MNASSWRRSWVAGLLLGLLAPGLPAQGPPKVTLRWKAADAEGSNYGYLVYRSKSRLGPYLRVNAEIVHMPKDGAKQHEYVFEDINVEPGATYYYYLDTIDTAGVKKRFSGVLPKTVESSAAAAPPVE
jgi:hypothetical protein